MTSFQASVARYAAIVPLGAARFAARALAHDWSHEQYEIRYFADPVKSANGR